MRRGTWIAVVLIAAVFAAVAAVAARTARRERASLVAGFSEEHLSRLRLAAREVEAELLDVGKDLDFAARLVGAAESGTDRRRELRALLAVVRGYRMVVVYDRDARQQLAVIDPLAQPSWSPEPFEGAFDEAARDAMSRGSLAVSSLVEGPHSPWNRVFATPLVAGGEVTGAVAILVDLRDSFERLRVVAPDPSSRLVVLRPDGAPAPRMPGAVAPDDLAAAAGRIGPLLDAMRAGETSTRTLAARDAAALGLGDAEAVAAFAPIRDAARERWSVAILDSTQLLHARERAITLQVVALGAALAIAFGLVSAYLVRSARRTIAVEERLRSESQLLRAEKLATVGVLAAGIAHEIGTPLGVIRGRAERIASKLGAEHPVAGSATVIVDEIDRIARIIRELLDYSRVSPAAVTRVSFEEVARGVLDLLAIEAASRKVSLQLELSHPVPTLAADADRLRQVLVNLVLNAVHACAPEGRVTVRGRAERGAERAILEVVDDGAGIPDELRHQVFDPFFTTKKRGKGTGLGLTVAAQIVRNHGGDIHVESAVGRGTSIVVSWPLAPAGAEEADEERDRRASPGGR